MIDIKALKSELNIESILHALNLENMKRVWGDEVRAICPIEVHSRTPDSKVPFKICLRTGNWYCHACNNGGDIINFIKEVENLSGFKDAVRRVQELNGEFVSDSRSRPTPKRKPKKDSAIIRYELQQILKGSLKTGNHKYLRNNNVKPCDGLFFGKDQQGNSAVVIPLYDKVGNLVSIQYVHELGKFYHGGTSYKGTFFPLKKLTDGQDILFAEGIATALTIYESYEHKKTVVSFGPKNNMAYVINDLRPLYQNSRFIICLDLGDAENEASKINSSDCLFVKPHFSGLTNKSQKDLTDFNDIVSKCNEPVTEVRHQINQQLKE